MWNWATKTCHQHLDLSSGLSFKQDQFGVKASNIIFCINTSYIEVLKLESEMLGFQHFPRGLARSARNILQRKTNLLLEKLLRKETIPAIVLKTLISGRPKMSFWSHRLMFRPKKYICVFQVSALKKLGMVGRHDILFCQNILYRNCIFQYISPHFQANLTTFCSQFTITCLGSGQKPR